MVFCILTKTTGNSLFVYLWLYLDFVTFRMFCLTDNVDIRLFNNSN